MCPEDAITSGATMRAVVCDDDALIRSVVGDLITERGGEVIAETERSADAVMLAERFEPDVIVLDLGLEVGSGFDVLRHFDGRAGAPAIVVFTAFDGIVDTATTTHIVRKPGFEQLARALDEVMQVRVRDADRRRPTRQLPAPVGRDDAGIDETAAFYEVLVESEPGDALVAVPTDGLDPEDLAATVRRLLRTDDRLTRRRGWLVALLVGGDPAAGGAFAQRLAAAVPDVGSRARIALTGDHPSEVFIDLTG